MGFTVWDGAFATLSEPTTTCTFATGRCILSFDSRKEKKQSKKVV